MTGNCWSPISFRKGSRRSGREDDWRPGATIPLARADEVIAERRASNDRFRRALRQAVPLW
jgi:hypothetical protein